MTIETCTYNETCEICKQRFAWEDIVHVNLWNFRGNICRGCLRELKAHRPDYDYRICITEANNYVVQKAEFNNGAWEYKTQKIKEATHFDTIEDAKLAIDYLKNPKDMIIKDVVEYL